MNTEWTKAHEAAAVLTEGGRPAVRLANLAVAAVVAHGRGLLPPLWAPGVSGEVLREAVEEIALRPLPDLYGGEREWKVLADRAAHAARAYEEAGEDDGWVGASQAADPGRKTKGAYATPTALARRLAVDAIAETGEGGIAPRVVDPSAGSGALLIAALQHLTRGADAARVRDIVHNLHGLEVDTDSREMCCLHLWIAAARGRPSLERIAGNVPVGNALTYDWWDVGSQPFDVVVMNPPWESLRHGVSEGSEDFDIREATSARLREQAPGAEGLPPLFSAQGRGDSNLYKAFLELAPHLLAEGGRLGALIPSAFASDSGMAPLRRRYLEQMALERWTSFENLRGLFPIDGRFKFGLLVGERSKAGTQALDVRSFATEPQHATSGHITLTRENLDQIGGPKMIIPELGSEWEMRTLARALAHGSPLFEPGPFGRVEYRREVDLTLGRAQDLFRRFESYDALEAAGDGTFRTAEGDTLVPLIEGRMVGQYDFYQKSWVSGSGRTAVWAQDARPLSACRPQFVAPPTRSARSRVAICDVTSATNTRTVHAAWVPPTWPCGNTAPVLTFENDRSAMAGLAVLNSMVFDWVARRLVAGLHLNRFYLETMVWPRLTVSEVDGLAGAASALCWANPRFGDEGSWSPVGVATPGLGHVDAHVWIERTVANGYGLSPSFMEHILVPNRQDRRGFWRHFDSGLGAHRIAAILREDT